MPLAHLCRADPRQLADSARRLKDRRPLARELGADFTPSFFLRRGDGSVEPVAPSDLTAESFTAALDAALAAR